jgi:hypothetical protein
VWIVIRHSAIYVGTLRHRRFAPVTNAFRYPLFMMYLDLEEVREVFNLHPLFSTGPSLAWLRRADHVGDASEDVSESVRRRVQEATGTRPAGPIRLLTHLRYFGHCFNPVSFYYCWGRSGQDPEAIVAEVHNTPWKQEYCYVCDVRKARRRGTWMYFELDKAFHVSPFMPMQQRYLWRFRRPGNTLAVYMQNVQCGRRVFDANLVLHRRPVTRRNLWAVLLRYPLMTVKVVAAIHAQALRLWHKGAPLHPHPEKAREEACP